MNHGTRTPVTGFRTPGVVEQIEAAQRVFRTPGVVEQIEAAQRVFRTPGVVEQIEAAQKAFRTAGIFGRIEAAQKAFRTPGFVRLMESAGRWGAVPTFDTMFANAIFPRPAWSSVFDDVRPAIADDLYAEVSEVLDDAEAQSVGGDVVAAYWVERLPVPTQLGLLTAALAALAELSQFVGELTHDGLPGAYYRAVRILVALAAVLLIVIEAQAKLDADHES